MEERKAKDVDSLDGKLFMFVYELLRLIVSVSCLVIYYVSFFVLRTNASKLSAIRKLSCVFVRDKSFVLSVKAFLFCVSNERKIKSLQKTWAGKQKCVEILINLFAFMP